MNPVTQTDSQQASGSYRHYIAIAIILLLAVIGLNFHWGTDSAPASATANVDEQQPDTIIDQGHLDSFDDTGRKFRQLNGQQIAYFDDDKHSIVDMPQVQFEQRGDNGQAPTPWQITATTATVQQTTNKIEFDGNVLLFSDATPGGRTEITTEQLFVDSARRFAETGKAVTIRVRNSEAKAIGMQADLANERLLLPSHVKEIHEVHR